MKKVKVQIYAPTQIWTGDVYCPDQRRLLDVLNSTLVNEKFLAVSEAKMRSLDGREVTVQSAFINKANILFVREIEGGQGLGGEVGPKLYPFVPKWSTGVTFYMPFYTLIGQMHHAKGKQVSDVLNSGARFLPITNVKISPLAGGSERVSFIAINRGEILSVEELGI